MRKTKRILSAFTFYDRTGIEALLEKEAQKGWLLEKVSAFGWKFRRIEPRKIHYAVAYFPKASAFDPGPSQQQQRFIEFCEHAGWKLAGSGAQMQIFYNEAENPVPIETDPQIELENIEKSAKKNYLPAYYLLLGSGLLQMGLLFWQLHTDFTGTLSSNSSLFSIVCWLMVLTMCAMEVGGYFLWRSRARKAIETDGSFVPTRGFRKIQLTLIGLEFLAFAVLLLTLSPKFAAVMIASLFIVMIPVGLCLLITQGMKRLGFAAEDNRIVSIVSAVILSVVFVGFGSYAISVGILWNWPKEQEETYDYRGMTFIAYDDTLPLNVEDLTEVAEGIEYSRYFRENASLLMGEYVANQHTRVGMDGVDLNYTIYDIRLPLLYEPALDYLLHRNDDWYGINGEPINYRETDAAPWQAERVFEEYAGDEPQNEYLLCYEDRIIYFRCDLILDESQMEIVAEKLSK